MTFSFYIIFWQFLSPPALKLTPIPEGDLFEWDLISQGALDKQTNRISIYISTSISLCIYSCIYLLRKIEIYYKEMAHMIIEAN